MGEPLDNYDALITAIRGMTDVRRFSLAASRITVSTVGVVPRLRRLAHDVPGVSLALSLHAPNQLLRAQIVPSSKSWHVDRIIAAMEEFMATNRERSGQPCTVMVEYVLIADVNDSDAVAHELGQLLQHRTVLLNVIPYNPTAVPFDYKAPTTAAADHFTDIVRGYGVRTVRRQELGQDIGSACGQLVVGSRGISGPARGHACEKTHDVEDLCGQTPGVPGTTEPAPKVRRRARKDEVPSAASPQLSDASIATGTTDRRTRSMWGGSQLVIRIVLALVLCLVVVDLATWLWR